MDLKKVLQDVSELIFVVDLNLKINYQNKASQTFYGDRKNMVCHEVIQGSDHTCRACPLKKTSAAKAAPKIVTIEKAKDKRYIEFLPGPVMDDAGKVTGCINIGRDVTREKVRDELRRDSLSMLSHDLKSPLTAIHGFAEILLGSNLKISDDEKEMLDLIKKTSKRAGQLVEEFVTLSRIESGKISNHPLSISFKTLMDMYCRKHVALAKIKNVTIIEEIPESIPDALLDEHHFSRIFSNLMNNAVTYTCEGATVCIKAGIDEREPGMLYFEVSDNGPGIPEDELPHLFEKYHPTKKKKYLSSGLGLAIVKALTELQGGKVEAKSRQGHGTSIKLILPEAPAKSK